MQNLEDKQSIIVFLKVAYVALKASSSSNWHSGEPDTKQAKHVLYNSDNACFTPNNKLSSGICFLLLVSRHGKGSHSRAVHKHS